MNKSGPIILIEDDVEDLELILQIFKEIKFENKVHSFSDGEAAYEFLTSNNEQPFVILSDINLQKLNGFELREKIHNNEQIRLKCIPYLFFSTTSEEEIIIQAYSQSIQGFFVKPSNYDDLKRILNNIIEYWKDCLSPQVH
jgi:CheY-like chemotaxis protein